MKPVPQTRKVPPYPDKPNEGMVQLELIPTPMADPSIEPGKRERVIYEPLNLIGKSSSLNSSIL